MSKHKSADDKLHTSPGDKVIKLPVQKLDDKGAVIEVSGPPKRTNANNQYR